MEKARAPQHLEPTRAHAVEQQHGARVAPARHHPALEHAGGRARHLDRAAGQIGGRRADLPRSGRGELAAHPVHGERARDHHERGEQQGEALQRARGSPRSEHRDGVDRRAGHALEPERRHGEEELPAIPAPRRPGRAPRGCRCRSARGPWRRDTPRGRSCRCGVRRGATSLWVSVPIIATPRSRSHGQHAAWSAGVPACSGFTGPSLSRRP